MIKYFILSVGLVSGLALGAGAALADEATQPAPGNTGAVNVPVGQEVPSATLVGVPVYDSTGALIGEVAEIVINTENGESRVLVDMGGFLGLGQHRVAVASQDMKIVMTDDGKIQTMTVLRTATELEALPNYDS